jgi:hypothetical protein
MRCPVEHVEHIEHIGHVGHVGRAIGKKPHVLAQAPRRLRLLGGPFGMLGDNRRRSPAFRSAQTSTP